MSESWTSRRRAVPGKMDLRLAVVGIITTSLFLALFTRLFYLQVLDGPQLAAAAKANTVRTVYEDAPRGRILDRNGNLLVGNREVDELVVDRDALSKDPTLLMRLAPLLDTDEATLKTRMANSKVSLYKPAVLATSVDKSIVAAVRERQNEFPGVMATTQVQRWYPQGTLAAHILGYVGEINEKELSADKTSDYRLGDDIGKSGIEQTYESDLKGRVGVDKIEVDSAGRPVRVLEHSPAVAGQDIKLTIDENVQRAAEDGLVNGLKAARGGSDDPKSNPSTPAPAGSAVALDPQDGSVLAMASFPTYDPASFINGIAADEYAKLTDPNNSFPLSNRAIQGQYAPGSTFKLVTSVAAIQSGVISGSTSINDRGVFVLGDRQYRNAQGAVYGVIDLPHALTVSSDVYFYNLGSQIWSARSRVGDPIQKAARDFGLGSVEGISVAGETAGRVPDPDSRAKLHKSQPDIYPEGNWYPGDNVNLAIGQGDTLATPLQLANLYATFGNGGTLYKPHLAAAVLNPEGRPIKTFDAEVIRKIDLPANVYGPIKQGLIGAVEDSRGTANAAFAGFDFNAFSMAGKTGTAQVQGKQDTALFSGYGPVDKPKIAVSVVLEEAGFGGAVAAPVARQIVAAEAGQSPAPVIVGSSVD